MADVPGAPDPKGFQPGNGGKIILEAGLNLVGKVGKAAKNSINQHFKDAADHNKNVAMREWEMQARHVLRKDFATHQNTLDINRDAQQQSSNERIAVTEGKTRVAEAQAGAFGKMGEAGVKGLAKKETVEAKGKVTQATMRTSARETAKLAEAGARETSVTKKGTQASFAARRATPAKKAETPSVPRAKANRAMRSAMRGSKLR
jgi:hypothetical protein